jgi:hypothetical protein
LWDGHRVSDSDIGAKSTEIPDVGAVTGPGGIGNVSVAGMVQ